MDHPGNNSVLRSVLQSEESSDLSKNDFGSVLRTISILSGCGERQNLIHDHYCKKYQLFVDDIKQGLNNYADIIMQETQSTQNYSKCWTSKLTPERLISLAKKTSNNIPVEENLSDLKLKFAPSSDLKRRMLNVIQESENVTDSKDVEVLNNSKPSTSRSELFNHAEEHAAPSNNKTTTLKSSQSNVSQKANGHLSNPLSSAFAAQIASTLSNNVGKSQPKPLILGKKSTITNKRQSEESVDQRSLESCPFKTAREQLILNKGKAESSSVTSVHQYGVSKRSLGTRRGLRSSFVPPVASSCEDNQGDKSPANSPQISSKAPPQPSGNPRLDELMLDERLKSFEPKLVELILNEIMDNGPKVFWDDIAGLEFVKNTIKEIVIFPMLRPDLFTGLRGPPKGLLLFGPPGTGKTLIGKCVAAQSKSTFFSVSASSLTSKWVGEGEKLARALFVVARMHQPAVIFIDEIDSLLSQRSEQEHESSRRIKTEFLIQLDGVSCEENERLLLIGATNRPQEIDEAARRRFVKRLYIPLPTSAARKQIVERLIAQHSHRLAEQDVDYIVEKANGYSGADMTNLCREAAMGPIRNISFETLQNITSDDVRSIELHDFENAFGQVRASVSQKDLDLYIEWNNLFGSYQINKL